MHRIFMCSLCWAVAIMGLGRSKQSTAQERRCYELAGNHIYALNNLALMLGRQSRATTDRHRAIALLRQAAAQGHSNAQRILAIWYQFGVPGVLEKDIAQAKHWYSLSAEQGNRTAVKALKELKTQLRRREKVTSSRVAVITLGS
eukprot:TRINITY_DN4337_c0_g2_i1.p1 TRINITY_DN4337_c0_g2~~TRINITY_DN4337_c0_g2_i1.p1  ORF type:complete len:145 (+),score=23.79 TRINITY_DN4337_c0_g2_i1:298-732(+)